MNKISEYINLYGRDLSRLCTSLTNTRDDAQDLYQATWEKAIRKISKYDSSKPFDKWLFAICVNTFKDMVKSPFRRKILQFDKTEELERTLNSISDTEISRDEFLSLHCAIKKLTVEKRQVLALYYFKDYSLKEVARILNIPEGTVKSRLSSARLDLRKELENE
ncbi:MAG: RNA polymerase sigma factor [Clostridia bacterium]|nr:RNA polymerase sigma factor [Clostridia bacterium]